MRILHSGKNTLCLASNPPEGLHYYGPLELEEEIEKTTDLFLRRPLFRRLLDLYSLITSSEGHVLLKAHGAKQTTQWHFMDGTRAYDMQSWLHTVDGTASAIFLFSCNPDNDKIFSHYSLVFHMDTSFTVLELVQRRKPVRLYVPGVGYVDQNRRLLHQTLSSLEASVETPLRKLA